jgi:predicted dehydrogenase
MTTFSDANLKVAVVGLGKMGMLHASILSTLPGVEVTAFCDKSLLMRKIAKRTLKTALVTSEVSELADLGLSAVYVTTPIPSHYPIIKLILENHICPNVFSEKTLSLNYTQSEELCRLASAHHSVGMVGYMKRFSVTFKKAKEILETSLIGQVSSFDAYAYSSDFADAKAGATVSLARGGVLEDLGSHIADLSLWLLGDLKVTSAVLQAALTQGATDDVQFQVAGHDGLVGNFEVSWLKLGYRMPEFGLTVIGSRGIMAVTDTDVRLTVKGEPHVPWFRQNLDDTVAFLLGDPEYYREDEQFIASIQSQSSPEPNFESATKVDCFLSQVESNLHE